MFLRVFACFERSSGTHHRGHRCDDFFSNNNYCRRILWSIWVGAGGKFRHLVAFGVGRSCGGNARHRGPSQRSHRGAVAMGSLDSCHRYGGVVAVRLAIATPLSAGVLAYGRARRFAMTPSPCARTGVMGSSFSDGVLVSRLGGDGALALRWGVAVRDDTVPLCNDGGDGIVVFGRGLGFGARRGRSPRPTVGVMA
jgi:hypothetical protein